MLYYAIITFVVMMVAAYVECRKIVSDMDKFDATKNSKEERSKYRKRRIRYGWLFLFGVLLVMTAINIGVEYLYIQFGKEVAMTAIITAVIIFIAQFILRLIKKAFSR